MLVTLRPYSRSLRLFVTAALVAAASAASPALAAPTKVHVLSATIRNKALEGATVVLSKGTEAPVTAVTDADGVATFAAAPFGGLDDRTVKIRIEKAGHMTLYGNCPCAGETFALSDLSLKGDGTRIVLNWGAKPKDLDAHLIWDDGHVYFEHPRAGQVRLDVDDVDGYGPETITIPGATPGKQYVFAVHDYSNWTNMDARGWATSRARVFVYSGSRLVRSFYVTPGKVGNVWVVFRIDGNGTVFDLDQFASATDAAAVDAFVKGQTWSIETGAAACGKDEACAAGPYAFAPHELPFPLPAALQKGMPYYSAPFYAVMLASRLSVPADGDVACGGFFTEEERQKAQAALPGHRVFASRTGCEKGAQYSNTNRAYEFLAVYGGATKEEAEAYLKTVKATKQFDGANLRKMQVVVKGE